MFNGNVPSLSDIAAVTGNNDGFGNGNGWWILIILFAIFGGWGNNGYVGGRSCDCATQGDLQNRFDNQAVTNKLNGLENGMASLGYDQLAQMNGINTNIMTSSNALQSQLANCCCENRQAIAQVRYDMATDTCSITNAINQAAQNIMQNDNANYRQLHDENIAARMEAKDEMIASLRTQIESLNLAQSQANQNNYLISQLRPAAIPAYTVPNPYYGYGYSCGCNQAQCC